MPPQRNREETAGCHHMSNNWRPPAGHDTFQWAHNRDSGIQDSYLIGASLGGS